MDSWKASMAIRTRRERLGLSQADVARSIDVSKSLLSMFESGKRAPTDSQVDQLAIALKLPRDLVALGSGRLPEDVETALESDALGAVAAIRERIKARAIAYPTEPSTVPAVRVSALPRAGKPIPERIDVAKTSTAYRAHSYHTKVPPEAITPFIRAFTRPGDVVCDPFCGSGMTGVAALMEGRNALLSDLSPAAVHIARNFTTPCDPKELDAALKRVEAAVAPTMAWLYRPADGDRLVEYTTWSDVYACRQCTGRMLYWDILHKGGVSNEGITCPRCTAVTRKADLAWVAEEPVQSHTSSGSNRIDSHAPTAGERALIVDVGQVPIPYWTPDVAFDRGREMWRAGHSAMGIASANDFFTHRNLHALGALRHAIVAEPRGRVREALMFAFTAAVNRASRRYQWNAKRPTNVMTGTLYVSSLRYEWNVWSLFRRKAADVMRYYRAFPDTGASAEVFQRSATDLGCLPDGAADMVFMDPPFGANIFYADASLLWDAWLGKLTDQDAEIVVNKHRSTSTGGKDLADYGDLMAQAFAQSARILKPGGRAVLAFSNSDDAVWEAVRVALSDAGLETERVHILNKGQPSIKGVKGVTGKENVTTFDLMLCLKHRRATKVGTASKATPKFVDAVIVEALKRGGRTDEIYSSVVRTALAEGLSVTGLTMPSVARRCAELGACETSGRWAIPPSPEAAAEPAFLEGYLAQAADIPVTDAGPAVAGPIASLRVSGGRNSAFYMAHSYHTKVPPEAITPFIEHYTKPGDVILDPFCGSGMTGVAGRALGTARDPQRPLAGGGPPRVEPHPRLRSGRTGEGVRLRRRDGGGADREPLPDPRRGRPGGARPLDPVEHPSRLPAVRSRLSAVGRDGPEGRHPRRDDRLPVLQGRDQAVRAQGPGIEPGLGRLRDRRGQAPGEGRHGRGSHLGSRSRTAPRSGSGSPTCGSATTARCTSAAPSASRTSRPWPTSTRPGTSRRSPGSGRRSWRCPTTGSEGPSPSPSPTPPGTGRGCAATTPAAASVPSPGRSTSRNCPPRRTSWR